MAAATARKFLFETSFDPEDIRRAREEALAEAERARAEAEAQARAEADAALAAARPEPEPEPEPPPPTFSEEELAAARAAAYAEGEQAGHAAAMASIEQHLALAMGEVPRQLADLVDDQRRSDEALAEQTVRIAVTLARKLMPELARRRGLEEIEALLRSCLTDMLDEPRIVVRVSDGLIDAVRDRLQPIADELGYGGALVLLVDPALGPADCRVEWADGGCERIADKLWQDIDAAVARFFDYPVAQAGHAAADAEPPPAGAAASRDTDAPVIDPATESKQG
jgi:flagellar assembly protein FliH